MSSPYLLCAVLLLGASSLAEGLPPEDVEEFFLTESAYSQEALELQATLGVSGRRGDTWQALELSLLAELGLTDWWQVELRAPFQWALPGGEARSGLSGIE